MDNLERRAALWRRDVTQYDCECSEQHLAEFARAELLRAAEMAREHIVCKSADCTGCTMAEQIERQLRRQAEKREKPTQDD